MMDEYVDGELRRLFEDALYEVAPTTPYPDWLNLFGIRFELASERGKS